MRHLSRCTRFSHVYACVAAKHKTEIPWARAYVAHATSTGNIKFPFNIFTRAGENDEVSCFLIMYPRTPEPRNSRRMVGESCLPLPFPSPPISSMVVMKKLLDSTPLLYHPVCPLLIFLLSSPFFSLPSRANANRLLFLPRSVADVVLSLHSTPSTLRLSFRAAIYRRDFILVVSVGAILCVTSASTLFPSRGSVMWSFTQTWSSSSLSLNDVIAEWFLTQVSIDYFNKII